MTHSELKNISRTEDEPGNHGNAGTAGEGAANGEVVQAEGPTAVCVSQGTDGMTEDPPGGDAPPLTADPPPVLLQIQGADPVTPGLPADPGKGAVKEASGLNKSLMLMSV